MAVRLPPLNGFVNRRLDGPAGRPCGRGGVASGGDYAMPVPAVDLEGARGRDDREGDGIVARRYRPFCGAARAGAWNGHGERRIPACVDAGGRDRDVSSVVLVADFFKPAAVDRSQSQRGADARDGDRVRRPIVCTDAAVQVVRGIAGGYGTCVARVDLGAAHAEGRPRSGTAATPRKPAGHDGHELVGPEVDHVPVVPRAAPTGGAPVPRVCLMASSLATSTGETIPTSRPLSKTSTRWSSEGPTRWMRAARSSSGRLVGTPVIGRARSFNRSCARALAGILTRSPSRTTPVSAPEGSWVG